MSEIEIKIPIKTLEYIAKTGCSYLTNDDLNTELVRIIPIKE